MQVRHQVDLTDLGKRGRVELKGTVYRYVLSVMDVFSRFIWLRPLPIENSRAVAAELKAIYIENGPLLALQSDQGSEFKGALKGLSKIKSKNGTQPPIPSPVARKNRKKSSRSTFQD